MNALTNAPNSATDRIRRQLERVTDLRTQAQQDGLSTAVHQVKQLQARRFRATYADFLHDPRYAAATAFFLDELYGEHDFAQRDAQFARIASAIERLFPEAVSDLAVDLAETHALTETHAPDLRSRLHNQHPEKHPPNVPRVDHGPKPRRRGSLLDADHPGSGVTIARRSTTFATTRFWQPMPETP